MTVPERANTARCADIVCGYKQLEHLYVLIERQTVSYNPNNNDSDLVGLQHGSDMFQSFVGTQKDFFVLHIQMIREHFN